MENRLNLQEFLCDMKIDGKKPFRALSDDMWSTIPYWIPTGAPSLDRAILNNELNTQGGIPHTRVIEIYGMESTGKSSLVDSIIRQFQIHYSGYTLLCDAEHAHEEDRMLEMDIDPSLVIMIEKDRDNENVDDVTLEEFFNYSEAALKKIRKEDKTTPALIVLDSLAMIDTDLQRKAQDQDRNLKMNESTDKSKIMSSRFGRFVSSMVANNATLIIVNQLREKPGVMFGDARYTPGGSTLRFLASVRIGLSKKETIKASSDIFEHDHDDPVGILVEFKIAKNKVAPPLRTGTFPIMFDSRGIWRLKCWWDIFMKDMKKARYLEKSGTWYSWRGEKLGQGEANSLRLLYENPDVFEDILSMFLNKNKEEEADDSE